jgi:hypothetical protein
VVAVVVVNSEDPLLYTVYPVAPVTAPQLIAIVVPVAVAVNGVGKLIGVTAVEGTDTDRMVYGIVAFSVVTITPADDR